MTPKVFSVKDPYEEVTLTFDFVRELSGETIQGGTASCVVAVISGTDASPSAILSGAAQISGTMILQKVIGGVDGVDYDVKAKITTSTLRKLVLAGVLPVRNL